MTLIDIHLVKIARMICIIFFEKKNHSKIFAQATKPMKIIEFTEKGKVQIERKNRDSIYSSKELPIKGTMLARRISP